MRAPSLFLVSNGGQDLTIEEIEVVGGAGAFVVEGAGPLPLTLGHMHVDDPRPEDVTRAITVRFDP